MRPRPSRRHAENRPLRRALALLPSLLLGSLAERVHAQSDRELAQIDRVAGFGFVDDLPVGGQIALRQAARDARNDRLIALVATHPDDQYVLPATFLRQFFGYRIAVILVTRGEGGQNREGPEIGVELGRLRTLETEVCARRSGYVVWYLNRVDAGYCRTGQEALDLWNERSTTEDLARLLRRIRPDLVMTTHHPGETHGHDLGLLAILPAAVELAGDPAFQTGAVAPVRIRRLFRGALPDERTYLRMDVDDVDPLAGRTYREIAYTRLTESHRSQAPFRPLDEQFADEQRFVPIPLRGQEPALSLHEGLPQLFTALPDTVDRDELQRLFERGLSEPLADPAELVRRAFDLRDRLRRIDAAPASSLALRIERRLQALERVVQHAIGLRVAARIDRGRSFAVPGEPLPFALTVNAIDPVHLRRIGVATARGIPIPVEGRSSRSVSVTASYPVPEDAVPWFDELYRQDRFELPIRTRMSFDIEFDGGASGTIDIPLRLPTDVRPAVEVVVRPSQLLAPDGVEQLAFNVLIRHNSSRELIGDLRVTVPPGFIVEPATVPIDMPERVRDYRFALRVPERLRTGIYPLNLGIGPWGARVPLHRVPVEVTPGLRVGLVEGVDDTAGSVLDLLGVEVVRLTDSELRTADLASLDTILIDIRALGHRPSALASLHRLLEFARQGGRLVVLYHKDQEFNLEYTGVRGHPAGLPLHIGKGRVTREDAPVKHNLPDHILLNYPNRIEPEHWDGWVQERGLYFPDVVDDAYERVLRMQDPGYPAETTSLLYAATGEGEYIYCALSLYRQLRNMHPGACRLFANLVSRRPLRHP